MIEKGDMVYWNNAKWKVRQVRVSGCLLLSNPRFMARLAWRGEIKPIYRNGVKVRV